MDPFEEHRATPPARTPDVPVPEGLSGAAGPMAFEPAVGAGLSEFTRQPIGVGSLRIPGVEALCQVHVVQVRETPSGAEQYGPTAVGGVVIVGSGERQVLL